MNSCGILEENQGKFVLSIPLSCKWMSFSFFGFNLCAYFTLVYFFTINAQICACVCIFFFFLPSFSVIFGLATIKHVRFRRVVAVSATI